MTLFERFLNDYYLPARNTSSSNEEAFETANERFTLEHDFPAFVSFETFRKQKARKANETSRAELNYINRTKAN